VTEDIDEPLYVMSPTEILVGFTPGLLETPISQVEAVAGPRQVLERLVRDALLRPPCGVAFSGGRDSSTVLAVATHVARRDGLPEPVPITRVFPNVSEAEESRWQERVVRHLRLRDWHRVVIDDELDVLGPIATARLVECGVLWPPTLAIDVPAVEAVPGGSVLDGEGGDEVLGDAAHRIAPVASLVRSPRPLRRSRYCVSLLTLAPGRVRARRLREQFVVQLNWLKPAGREVVLAALEHEERRRPLPFATSVRMVLRKRKQVLAIRNRRILAARSGVEMFSPLLHPHFVEAIARAGGRLGPGDRTAVLRAMVPDLLPDDVLARTSKGEYTRCNMGRPTREFAAQWSGEGADLELVDADELRRLWLSPTPIAMTAAILQSAWLNTRAERAAVAG
jgi:asparagine synthetase B (glutamine-hydrolysing)